MCYSNQEIIKSRISTFKILAINGFAFMKQIKLASKKNVVGPKHFFKFPVNRITVVIYLDLVKHLKHNHHLPLSKPAQN